MRVTFRTAAAVAIACAAVALPASALAAPASARTGRVQNSAAVSRCLSFNMVVWIGLPGNGTAGTTFYPLEFTNIGRRTCYLFGYPRVLAVSGSGSQIGGASTPLGPARLTTLRPGATVHAILGIVEAGNIAGCHMRGGAMLKVHAPGQVAATTIPDFTFTACTNKRVLRVMTVRPGVGIPGVTNS